jgi:hypothetical protein
MHLTGYSGLCPLPPAGDAPRSENITENSTPKKAAFVTALLHPPVYSKSYRYLSYFTKQAVRIILSSGHQFV